MSAREKAITKLVDVKCTILLPTRTCKNMIRRLATPSTFIRDGKNVPKEE